MSGSFLLLQAARLREKSGFAAFALGLEDRVNLAQRFSCRALGTSRGEELFRFSFLGF